MGYTQVLFIDSTLSNYSSIASSCNSNTLPIIYTTKTTSAQIFKLLAEKIGQPKKTTIKRVGIYTNTNCSFLNGNPIYRDVGRRTVANPINTVFIENLKINYKIANLDFISAVYSTHAWIIYLQNLPATIKGVAIFPSTKSSFTTPVNLNLYTGTTANSSSIIQFNNIYNQFIEPNNVSSGLILNIASTLVITDTNTVDSNNYEIISYSIDGLSSININNSTGWPITVVNSNTNSTVITVSFSNNLLFNTGNSQYFIAQSNNITFNGSHTVTINNCSSYPGLVQFGTPQYSNINIENIGVLVTDNSYLATDAGWIGQAYSYGNATKCYSTGVMSDTNGGIFGSFSSGTITNCYSTGGIHDFSGGIFGYNSSGNASNCYSTGAIQNFSGGIFSVYSSGNATNCYSVGCINLYSCGIIGDYSTGIATNCYSVGLVNDNISYGISDNLN